MALFNPEDRRPVHFVGIGGAGMSALALIACHRGITVTGCDADPAGANDLAALGVPVEQGHSAAHVDGARAVVHTAAVPSDHPELARARALGVPVVPRKVALAELVAGARTLAVSGTHGKTTTTVMATEVLAALGQEPTGIAGGRVAAWGGNARLAGKPAGSRGPAVDPLFVVEADEYDRAFLALEPTVAIVNNVEPDHLECYGSVAALEDAFTEFAGRAEAAFLGADDAGARKVGARLAGSVNTRAVSFGLAPDAGIRIYDVRQNAEGTAATVRMPDRAPLALQLTVPGLHNLRNAVGALAAALHMAPGAEPEPALDALRGFRGVGRRFERLGEFGGVALVDDYAHHPSELAATLAAARQAFPGRRLVAVFQPHLYSRTAQHGAAMGEALARADVVIVTEIYAAREQPIAGVSGRDVARAAAKAGAAVEFAADRDTLGRVVRDALRPGDVVLILGAGDITRVGPELVRWLQAA
ncbi:MAG TPA: UDP-N-acetylmuramate--L-alanine ligase [Gemmatimonadales bacterium]|nr:UDP-N-acetylmuramate--L-alanine ligase [Gemmatimonadales bacterium]